MFLMPERFFESLSRCRVMQQLLFLRVVLELAARLGARLELLEAADLLLDRLEVGEQAAEPALGDVHARRSARPRPARSRRAGAWCRRRGRCRRAGSTSRTSFCASSSCRSVFCRSMMWMPLRSAKMKRRILGFHRRVWCPKWTPASRSCSRFGWCMSCRMLRWVVSSASVIAADRPARPAPAAARDA